MAGVYVHVPFCHAKCAYCDFYSTADTRRREAFVDRIEHEYKARSAELGVEAVRTIYFGGGTPSILPASAIERLSGFFPQASVEEFTLEVNPEDVTPEAVEAWCNAGVNRVSMGVQSLVDEELAMVRRRHSAQDALRAIDTLRTGGIANLSVDLIYGLPLQTVDTFQYSLDTLLNKGIEHLSAYNLSFEEGTLLTRMLREGRVTEADEETIIEMYERLCATTRQAGLEHYEISNFGRPGYHSRHNSSYWDGTPYLGLGPGAHSCDSSGVRRFNSPNLREYLAGATPIIDKEDERDVWNDRIITALRTSQGLDLNVIPTKYKDSLLRNATPFIESSDLIAETTRIRIPEDKWLISNFILSELLIAED